MLVEEVAGGAERARAVAAVEQAVGDDGAGGRGGSTGTWLDRKTIVVEKKVPGAAGEADAGQLVLALGSPLAGAHEFDRQRHLLYLVGEVVLAAELDEAAVHGDWVKEASLEHHFEKKRSIRCSRAVNVVNGEPVGVERVLDVHQVIPNRKLEGGAGRVETSRARFVCPGEVVERERVKKRIRAGKTPRAVKLLADVEGKGGRGRFDYDGNNGERIKGCQGHFNYKSTIAL